VKPRQVLAYLIGVHATTSDMPDVSRFTRENRRAGKVPEIRISGDRKHFALPAVMQGSIEVKCDPSES
jgi:hypothetical protein